MVFRNLGFCFALALSLLASSAFADALFRNAFIDALEKNDNARLSSVTEKNKDKIPEEVKALLAEAAESKDPKEKDSKLFIAELMSVAYKDLTGDIELVKEVKRKNFDLKLSEPVRSALRDGAHVVELPSSADHEKNVFRPNNIIIKKGEQVKWVNNDGIAHVFSSMPLIGAGGLFTPSIEPGQSWSHAFDKPGDYYYICFIHRGMIGKITVEE